MSMNDEIRKELKPMAAEITELVQQIDQLSRHIADLNKGRGDDLTDYDVETLRQAAADTTAEAVKLILDAAKEAKEEIKAEAVKQIKSSKKESGGEIDWSMAGIFAAGVFLVMLIAAAIPSYCFRYVPGTDYGYVKFFNDTVSTNGKDGDLVIELKDSTREINRKIDEYFKRERGRQQNQN